MGAKFTREADFEGSKFAGNAYFLHAKFISSTSFSGAYFKKYAPTFADTSGSARFSARFSVQMDPKDYVFSVRGDSKFINHGTATLDGQPFIIPLGAVLFDPDSWDEKKQDYTRLSEPAK